MPINIEYKNNSKSIWKSKVNNKVLLFIKKLILRQEILLVAPIFLNLKA